MKKYLVICFLVCTVVIAMAQKTTVQATVINAREQFILGGKSIVGFSDDTNFIAPTNNQIPTQFAIKKYADSHVGGRPIDGVTVPTSGQVLKWDGSKWRPDTDGGGSGGASLPSTQIGYGTGAGITGNNQFVYSTTGGGRIGVGRSVPLAPIHVGSSSSFTSNDPAIVVSREINNAGTGSSHGFSDVSRITRTNGLVAYNSFDGRVVFDSTGTFHHYVPFQSAPQLLPTFTGTITDLYGLYTTALVQGGTITNNFGAYFADPVESGSGQVINNFGIYIQPQYSGIANWAMYSAGIGATAVGGTFNLLNNAPLGLGPNLFTPVKPLHVRRISGTESSIRIDQDGQNYWDLISPAGSTDFVISDVSGEKMRMKNSGAISFPSLVGTGSAILSASSNGTLARTGILYDEATKRMALSSSSFALTENFEVRGNYNTKTSFRLYQNSVNYWDLISPATSSDFVISDVSGEKMRMKNSGAISFPSLVGSGNRLVVCSPDGTISAGAGANPWVQGGNSFGAPGILGTNDNQPLRIKSNTYGFQVNNGYITLDDTPTNPTAPEGSIWRNSSNQRLYFQSEAGQNVRIATIEQDFTPDVLAIYTANATIEGRKYCVRADANAGSFTLTAGSLMVEGRDYVVACKRNNTNTVTITAESGYALSADFDASLSSSSIVAGNTGTGLEAPGRTYILRRIGTLIIIK